jgi:UDP-2,3-diacylglucosamine pyrophosphatase LpxH
VADKTLEERLARVEGVANEREKEIKRLRRALANSGTRVAELERFLDRYAAVKPQDQKVPAWVKPRRRRKAHHGTPVLMLSDLHLDEVVEPAEMDGLNEYNRAIAHQRLEGVVNSAVMLMHDYVAGLTLDGIVVPLLGDIITGDIHEELAKTNEDTVQGTIVHWVPALAAALSYLADEFGHVFVPCVDGNHDRGTKKTQAKKRTESSNAWIIYNWLADTLRDDERITFSIGTSPHQRIDVYDTRFLLAHGDAFRSAGGVGGLYPSMNKWLLRMHNLYSNARNDFDYALIGHWHQLLWGSDFVVNGSLKGYDEYARHGGFNFEEPQQALFVVTPERGVVQRMPVFAN